MRKKLPFGIGQIGKSFRNEITPGNFTFRTREFEQMELEFFCKPGEDLDWFRYWRGFCRDWLLGLGMKETSIRLRDHADDELSHYSSATTDIEYRFPFGWGELWGIADRTDYDLKQHMAHAGEDFHVLDPDTNERYIPYCIEPSLGADRVTLAFLVDAYEEQQLEADDSRVVLRLHPALAPVKAAVFPLSKKLAEGAQRSTPTWPPTSWSTTTKPAPSASGTAATTRSARPCASRTTSIPRPTAASTVRDRDTMAQVRLPIAELRGHIAARIAF